MPGQTPPVGSRQIASWRLKRPLPEAIHARELRQALVAWVSDVEVVRGEKYRELPARA